jgi:hypothetical protein
LPVQLDSTTAPPLQVYLSYRGTAVPGVDYTPITQPITFKAGQDSAPVQIPILPGSPSEGSRLLEIDMSPAPGAPPTNAAFVLITHNADTTPPKIIATRMVTRGPYVKKFVLTFNKDMAPGPIQDVSNYAIADPRSVRPVPGLEWTTARRQITLKSAVYDPISHSVTLTPAGKVRKYPMFMIMDSRLSNAINAIGQKTPPTAAELLPSLSPITDTTGNPLDGIGNGVADGMLEAIVAKGKAGNRFLQQVSAMSGP